MNVRGRSLTQVSAPSHARMPQAGKRGNPGGVAQIPVAGLQLHAPHISSPEQNLNPIICGSSISSFLLIVAACAFDNQP